MVFSAEIGRRVDERGGWFVGSCGISKPAENVIALHAGEVTGEPAKEMALYGDGRVADAGLDRLTAIADAGEELGNHGQVATDRGCFPTEKPQRGPAPLRPSRTNQKLVLKSLRCSHSRTPRSDTDRSPAPMLPAADSIADQSTGSARRRRLGPDLNRPGHFRRR